MSSSTKHRKPGSLGSFTVHAPADYKPDHRGHVCTDVCDPGNCEVAHHEEFFIPEDEA